MTTRQTLEKVPVNVVDRIETIRKYYNNPDFEKDRSAIRAELYGYTAGLRDAGLITEQDRKTLFIYGTV